MRERRIITFGLTEEQNAIVVQSRPARDYEVFDTDAPTDVIAIGCIAIIVYAPAMDMDSVEMMFDYYSEVNGCTDETVIWLGDPKPPKHLQKFFKCYDSFEAVEEKLKYLLLNAHSKSKKASEYSEKLVNGLKILAKIRSHPGVTTQELADDVELPIRSVQRYISALQATGEWIEYDRTIKGWKLFHGTSILFGDVWDGEWD